MTDENEVVVQLVDRWSLRSSSGTELVMGAILNSGRHF